MSEQLVFSIGVLGTAAASAAIALFLRRPLLSILVDLCGNQQRAEFWTAFSLASMVLAPTVFALGYVPDHSTAALIAIGSQLKWGLIGLLAALVVMAWVLSRFILSGGPPAHRPIQPSAASQD